MDPQIPEIIPPAGYMLVRDAIGAILLTELTNQRLLQNFPETVIVYQERIKPIQADESLYINVLLDSATNSQFTARERQGLTVFYIDVYTTGVADPANNQTGDLDSATRLHSFMNMIVFILSHNAYATLGFQSGFIGGRYVNSFATAEPQHFDDSNYSRMARINFAVRIQETTPGITPQTLGGNDTTVKLQLTNHGYQYVFNAA